MAEPTAKTKTESKDLLEGLGDVVDSPVTKIVGYSEDNPSHVIDPFAQSGTVDTSDTSGTANNSIREVSPVFDIARAQNLQLAARALDPNDLSVPEELVVLPAAVVTVQGTTKTAEEGKLSVLNAVRDIAENPVEIGGLSPAQKEAAEDTSGDAEAADAKAEDKSDATPVRKTSATPKSDGSAK